MYLRVTLTQDQHAVTISFGLEASVFILERDDYDEIISMDCPGPNPLKFKSEKLRSFMMPEHFIEDESRVNGEKRRLINIFVAFVMETHVIVVSDFSRLIRLHVNSRCRMWMKEDLEVGSDVGS
jgi:tricorn protease-like protein